MSPQRSRRKKLRDKRRLLSFIMRKRSKGEEVEIDYWQMCIDLKETNFLNDIAIDLKKHSEQRYFSLICTVQRSRHSLETEKDFVYNLIEDRNMKIVLGPKSEILSSNPTKFGDKNEFTHRFRIYFILDQFVDTPNNYVWRMLRRESFEFDRGKRIFFKL